MSSFQLNRRGVLARAAAGALATGLPAGAQGQPSGASRPNLILFIADELRADAVGCYGNPLVRTPNLDRLAAGGARFESCHVQDPVCSQSRCSLLTGWYPNGRGHRSLGYLLQRDEPNLFRYLKEAGYDTYWFGKNDALSQDSFPLSLTEWADPPAPGAAAGVHVAGGIPVGAGGPNTMLLPPSGDRRATSDYAVIQRAVKILERREQERPFCLFLPIFQPHPPYRAPDNFQGMYKPSDVGDLAPPDLPKKPVFHDAIRRKYGLKGLQPADFQKVRAVYYGQVTYMDWLLGQLLEAMERTGRDKDTAIFFASDHGDYAGDYGLVEKWPSGLESCLTHVPLVARIPGGEPGVVRPEMTELFDIMPTMLALGGSRARHNHFARSLLPQLHGATGDPDRAAYTEGGYNIYEPQAYEDVIGGIYAPKAQLQVEAPETIERAAAVRTQRYTYIRRTVGQSELYDRQSDPSERNNLIDDGRLTSVRADLEGRMLSWFINTSGVISDLKDRRDAPPFSPSPDGLNRPEARDHILDRH